MRALVVVESMFGNTEAIAEAVAAGLADAGLQVERVGVAEAPGSAAGWDLLIVAAPTHAFSLSREGTRSSAVEQGGQWEGPGVREWLATLRDPGRFATLDTKVRHPNLPGSAGGAAQRALVRRGGTAVVPHESFWVEGTPGPLLPGEIERARAWAQGLGATVMPEASGTGRPS